MELQNIFYISVIVLAITGTVFVITSIYIMIKLYTRINDMLKRAQATAGQVHNTLSEIGEQGGNVLRLFTKEGQKAISASTLVSMLMNGYFLFRTIFGHKRKG